MDWPRALVIIERFERLTRMDLHELQLLLQSISENNSLSNSKSKRYASQKIDQLLSSLKQVLNLRSHLSVLDRERFDVHIEPIRIQIQRAINAMNGIAAAETPEETNIYDDLYEKSLLADKSEGGELQEKQIRINSLLLQAKEAKANAIKVKKLACDVEDLNEIMMQLAQLVHSHHDVVDSIEEHVENAHTDVHKAHKNLKKAQYAQTMKYPVVAATIGSIAVGGPMGFVAGSAVVGTLAAFAGAVAGMFGGKYFRQKVQETSYRAKEN